MIRRAIVAVFIVLSAASFLSGAFITYATKPVYIVTATFAPLTRSGLGFIPHQPGCLTRPDYHYCYDINSYGFRGKEPVADSRCRVGIVGSSFAFAPGVYDESTWGALLENDQAQPFNLAFGGATLYDALDIATRASDLLHLDVLIVTLTPAYDDAHMDWAGHTDARQPGRVEASLRPFQALKPTILFAVLPSQSGQDHAALLAVASKLGWPAFVPILGAGDFYPGDGHYTIEGNRKVAAQIAPEVRKLCAMKR